MQLLEDKNRDYQRYRHSPRERNFLGLQGLQPVLSSNVSAVGVKDTSLLIRFHNGSVYEYFNKADQYDNLLKSNSKGKWVWRFLRRRFAPFQKLGVIPLPDDIGVTDEDIFQEIDNRYLADLTRHVDVPVFQSFEFIKGINMQKIMVGNIVAYKPITKPLEVGARILPKAEIEFIPAKDIDEANEYAKKFANNVDLKKININRANTINKTLDTMQERFPMGRKLTNVTAIKLKNKSFAQANREIINFDITSTNDKQFNGKEVEKKQYAGLNKRIAEHLNNLDEYIKIHTEKNEINAVNYYKKEKTKWQKKLGYNRWSLSADSDTQDEAITKTTIHEYGHVIDFNFVHKQGLTGNTFDDKISKLQTSNERQQFILERIKLVNRFDDLRKKAVKNGQIKQVSEYGASNSYETFAETFTMYNTGEQDKLPNGFKEYYDDLEVFIKKVVAL
jgi:hypothetical protein